MKKTFIAALIGLMVNFYSHTAIVHIKNYTQHTVSIWYQSYSTREGEAFQYVNRAIRLEPGEKIKKVELFSKIKFRGADTNKLSTGSSSNKIAIWGTTPYKVWVRETRKKWLLGKAKTTCYGPTDMLEDLDATEIVWVTLYDLPKNMGWHELKEKTTKEKLCPFRQDGSSTYSKKDGENFSETKTEKLSPTKYFGPNLRKEEEDID